MKNVTLILLLIFVLGCKEKSKKKETNNDLIENIENTGEVLTGVNMLNEITSFRNVAVTFSETKEFFSGEPIYLLSRDQSDSKSSYAQTEKVDVQYAETYRASVIVKKGETGNLFGLRIQGNYPDRVDAVFDLDKGAVVGVQKTQDFEEEKANIEALSDGWFICSVTAEVGADKVVVFFGPTMGKKSIDSWTHKTGHMCNAYFVPSSIKLQKVTN